MSAAFRLLVKIWRRAWCCHTHWSPATALTDVEFEMRRRHGAETWVCRGCGLRRFWHPAKRKSL